MYQNSRKPQYHHQRKNSNSSYNNLPAPQQQFQVGQGISDMQQVQSQPNYMQEIESAEE